MKKDNVRIFVVIVMGFMLITSFQPPKLNSFAQHAKPTLKLEIEYIETGVHAFPIPNPDSIAQVLFFNTKLSNISMDTITFLSMTCTYEDLYEAKPKSTFTIHPDFTCLSNMITTIKIAPCDTYERIIMVRPLNKITKFPISLQICFNRVMLDENKEYSFDNYLEYVTDARKLITESSIRGIKVWSNKVVVSKNN